MRRIASLLLAAASLLAAAERPRYGGALRIQTQATCRTVEPAEFDERFAAAVFETLTTLDERGRPQPALAVSWRATQAERRWTFRLRRGVVFHDGSPLTPASVAASLSAASNGWNVTATADAVVIQFENANDELPAEVAQPRYAVLVRSPDGALSGTGPFRIAQFEPGKRVLLKASEAHWQGRPFLDEIQIEMGRSGQQQALDLDLGRAGLVEAAPSEIRRLSRERAALWSSAPVSLIAIQFERLSDPRLREAIAAAVDRAAIHSVLLQRQGEVAGAVLPQWITGYAFLFPTPRDVARARELAGTSAAPLSIGYDPADPLTRMVAERVAVNARDAGLKLNPVQGAAADLRVVRVRTVPGREVLGVPASGSPETRYAAERAVVEEFRVVPLAHVPDAYAASRALRSWNTPGLLKTGQWRLDDLWLSAHPGTQ